jgi:hypothetical protein
VRIARKGVESSQRLGRHRWIVEACLAWLQRHRRLIRRYDRRAERFQARSQAAHMFDTMVDVHAVVTCIKPRLAIMVRWHIRIRLMVLVQLLPRPQRGCEATLPDFPEPTVKGLAGWRVHRQLFRAKP